MEYHAIYINCVHALIPYVIIASSFIGLYGRKRLLIKGYTRGLPKSSGCGLRANLSGMTHWLDTFTAFVDQRLILRRQGYVLRLLANVLPHLAFLALLLRLVSAVLLGHHLLLYELCMAPLSPHPQWWWLLLHLLLVLRMAPILLILTLLFQRVIACLAGASLVAPPSPIVQTDVLK